MAVAQERVNKVGVNQFRFSGKISDKKFQFSGAGKMWGSVKVTIPSKDEKFKQNFFVKFFGETAEKAESELKDGSNYLFYGNVKNGSYLHKTTGQKVWTTDYIVNGWTDAVENDFSEAKEDKDDVPF